jgi:hypothetical protein
MSEIKFETTIKTTTTATCELSTDQIETIIREALNLRGDIEFEWHVGQWVSLTVTVMKEVVR